MANSKSFLTSSRSLTISSDSKASPGLLRCDPAVRTLRLPTSVSLITSDTPTPPVIKSDNPGAILVLKILCMQGFRKLASTSRTLPSLFRASVRPRLYDTVEQPSPSLQDKMPTVPPGRSPRLCVTFMQRRQFLHCVRTVERHRTAFEHDHLH